MRLPEDWGYRTAKQGSMVERGIVKPRESAVRRAGRASNPAMGVLICCR